MGRVGAIWLVDQVALPCKLPSLWPGLATWFRRFSAYGHIQIMPICTHKLLTWVSLIRILHLFNLWKGYVLIALQQLNYQAIFQIMLITNSDVIYYRNQRPLKPQNAAKLLEWLNKQFELFFSKKLFTAIPRKKFYFCSTFVKNRYVLALFP